jgi:hypothetical protein
VRTQPTAKVLGVALTPPSLPGLFRLLVFLLTVVAAVEVVDLLTRAAWSDEGSLAVIVGAFSGFLLNECGASFTKHGWRVFVLLLGCSGFVFAAASLIV